MDSPVPFVSLFRQILDRIREPMFRDPKEYYRGRGAGDAARAASPPIPGPEYHFTFFDTPIPVVSLLRQILGMIREPKFVVPKEYLEEKGSGGSSFYRRGLIPGHGYDATFVDSSLPIVSLLRQIVGIIREPKFVVPKEYEREDGALGAGRILIPGPGYHATFVDSTLPPVSLVRQIVDRIHEPIRIPKELAQEEAMLAAEEPPAPQEDPNQLALPFAPSEAAFFPSPAKPIAIPADLRVYHPLLERDPEAIKWRRRTMYLSSIMAHGVLVLLLVFAPELVRGGKRMIGIPVEVAPKKEYSFLLLPPDLLRRLREPPPENAPLSDRDRRAQGRSPVINPKGLHMPYSLGNTPLPEIAGGKPPAPTPPAAAASPAPPGPPANQPPNQNPLEAKNDGLRLDDVKPNTGGGGRGLNLPDLSPGQAIQQSLQSAVRAGRYPGAGSGGGVGYGDGNGQFQNLQPNFSTQGPIILSDTLGVDFGPYLARVVFIVHRNWYSMIPESARLGERGRVALVFEILEDGSVPQLRLVASSGSDPLDRAALASIHASIPFPPLPEEFTGNHLVLEFIYLYNMSAGQ
jgi:TonB family protein